MSSWPTIVWVLLGGWFAFVAVVMWAIGRAAAKGDLQIESAREARQRAEREAGVRHIGGGWRT